MIYKIVRLKSQSAAATVTTQVTQLTKVDNSLEQAPNNE